MLNFNRTTRTQPTVISLVDGPNLLIGMQTIEVETTGKAWRDFSVRLNVPQMVDFFANDRTFSKQILAARSDRHTVVWNQFKEQAYEVHLLPGYQGREVAVDDVMHAQAFHELDKDYRGPRVLQLVTGDGGTNHGRTSFVDVVIKALRKSIPVEIYAFRRSCSGRFKDLARQYPDMVKIIYLDEYREGLIFRQAPRPIVRAAPPPQGDSADTVAEQLHAWISSRYGLNEPMFTSAPLAAFYRAHPGAREIIQGATAAGHANGIQSFVAKHSSLLRWTRAANQQATVMALAGVPLPTSSSSAPAAPNVASEDDDASSAESEWEHVSHALVRSIKDNFICPISGEIMTDPVVTADGHTYERESIEQWFMLTTGRGQPATSPMTNEVLPTTDVVPNIALRAQIRSMESVGVGLAEAA